MRLVNVETMKLESFATSKSAPEYAILSHTWRNDEVLFEDFQPDDRDVEIAELRSSLANLADRLAQLEEKTDAATSEQLPNTPDPANDIITSRSAECTGTQRARKKAGWNKLQRFCAKARCLGYDYAWIDTVCIDKSVRLPVHCHKISIQT